MPTLHEILGEPRQNKNTRKKLDDIIEHVTEQLRFVETAPSVQFATIPPDLGPIRDEVERRIKEEVEGVYYTIVNGQVLLEDGEHTGALPGRVLRNSWYHAHRN